MRNSSSINKQYFKKKHIIQINIVTALTGLLYFTEFMQF